jgi:hypothetical protein
VTFAVFNVFDMSPRVDRRNDELKDFIWNVVKVGCHGGTKLGTEWPVAGSTRYSSVQLFWSFRIVAEAEGYKLLDHAS